MLLTLPVSEAGLQATSCPFPSFVCNALLGHSHGQGGQVVAAETMQHADCTSHYQDLYRKVYHPLAYIISFNHPPTPSPGGSPAHVTDRHVRRRH